MRLRSFLRGVVLGLALAPASGRETWRMARDRLSALIDAALRIGVDTSSPVPRTY